MPQKSHSHNTLSTKQCSHKECSKFLKLRLVEEKPTTKLCYQHYKESEAARGHFVDHQPRQARILAGLPTRRY
jgi:hypothetical protein